MNVVLLHCKQYTRRGAFNFHNCSDIKITYATLYKAFLLFILLFIMLLVSFSLSHFGDDCIS